MHTENYIYDDGNQTLQGFLAYDNQQTDKRPAVLVVHDWSGRNAFACEKAERLAEQGYLAFAVDMYGEGRLGETVDEKKALMTPIINDGSLLRRRMQAGLSAVAAMKQVDVNRIAVIGFCFGGLCALELARSGARIAGVVSFHGLLNRLEGLPEEAIHAKILALHGYDDPMVPPEQLNAFCQEMTKAGVDWQANLYGHTKHAFTNPKADDETLGTVYQKEAAKRSWQAMNDFLHELFR